MMIQYILNYTNILQASTAVENFEYSLSGPHNWIQAFIPKHWQAALQTLEQLLTSRPWYFPPVQLL